MDLACNGIVSERLRRWRRVVRIHRRRTLFLDDRPATAVAVLWPARVKEKRPGDASVVVAEVARSLRILLERADVKSRGGNGGDDLAEP
jgi:hypothetical protein